MSHGDPMQRSETSPRADRDGSVDAAVDGTNDGTAPIRILLLEDDPRDAELAEARLRRACLRIEVERVAEREPFVQALQRDGHDLILADYSLPAFDGAEALQIAHTLRPEIPFVFLSGTLGEEVAIDMLRRGADDYVLKHRLDRLPTAVAEAVRNADDRASRRRAEEELRKSEMLAKRMIEDVREYAIFMLDLRGRVISWNAGAQRLLGFTEREILGNPFSVFQPLRGIMGFALPPSTRLDGSGEDRAQVSHWLCRKDGSQLFVSDVTTLVRDEAGRPLGYSKVLHDITERLRLESELRRRNDELMELDRRKNQFLAMLAHELRNPLSAVSNSLAFLQLAKRTDDDISRGHQIMARQLENMCRLIDDLLDAARATQGKITLSRRKLDFAEVVRHSVEVVRPAAEGRNHRLSVKLPNERLWMSADPTRLEQVVTNLLNNAVKYTDADGTIDVSVHRTDGRIELTVCDDGVGMTAELIARAFDLFTQADRSLDRSAGGLGIGLTMVKSLVDLHGGTVRAESDGPGRGSCFTVSLPAVAPGDDASPDEPEVATLVLAKPTFRILIVEDNADAAESLRRLLSILGHEVRTAGDGPRALEVAVQMQPHLVLLDIGLPGMDGYEVARRMAERRQGNLPLLAALSGYGGEEDRARAAAAGFQRHFTKPLQLSTLEVLLTELAELRSAPT